MLRVQMDQRHEIHLAVLGLGAFAMPAARFMGTDELRGVFHKLLQLSDRLMESSGTRTCSLCFLLVCRFLTRARRFRRVR